MSNTTASDYTVTDGYDEGRARCPHCTAFLSGTNTLGEVYSQQGERFEHIYATMAQPGPFFCADCWAELEANRRANENHGLGEFA